MFLPLARGLKSHPLTVKSMIPEISGVQILVAGGEKWGIAWASIIPFGRRPRQKELPLIILAFLESGDMKGPIAPGDAATRSGPRK